jgi:hypothetical protein
MLLMYAMQRSRGSFELVVKCQEPIKPLLKDPRITWDSSAPDDRSELYEGFDALIYPRKYGGLALPLPEALASGLPVIMPNVSPNNTILPIHWLVPGAFNGGFTSRVPIPYFNVNIALLPGSSTSGRRCLLRLLINTRLGPSSYPGNSIRRCCDRSTRPYSGNRTVVRA